jgi:hypothetical protein
MVAAIENDLIKAKARLKIQSRFFFFTKLFGLIKIYFAVKIISGASWVGSPGCLVGCFPSYAPLTYLLVAADNLPE